MSTEKINIKTVIAVLFLIVDVLAIRWSFDAKAENEMHHHMTIVSHYSGIKMTLNKDITEILHGKMVTVPAGTVVTTIYISETEVYFSYSGECMSRGYEDFKEQDQFEKIKQDHEEVKQKNNAERQRVINEYKGPKITMMLFGLLIGSLITFILVKIKWYALLYVFDVVFVFLLIIVSLSC
jgi:acid phosphatase family membrane protein YuiD